jgi:hypothetical protein
MCEWEGLTCGGKKGEELTEIDLSSYQLAGGTIPAGLGSISSLQKIRLNATGLVGSIPRQVANLPNLVEFTVSNNFLEGIVPTFYAQKLQTLNLSFNMLVGPFSSSFYYGSAGHEYLETLDVESNQLSGTISDAIGMWHSLDTLSLTNNDFSGTMPATLGVLASSHLKFLYMDDNHFVGTIPEELAGAHNSQLEEIWLHENHLSGTIPAAFADIPTLVDFYVDGNKLTGAVPPDLCQHETINADFFDSTEEGARPDDPCDMLVCPNNEYSLEGMFPCKKCPTGQKMPWLGGEERCFHQDTMDILRKFYHYTNGESWTINGPGGNDKNNWFYDDAGDDYCEFEGIQCNEDGHVSGIVLVNAGLTGKIPPDLMMLEHLQTLDLADNDLTGGLPSDLRLASSLTRLDISGNKLKGPVPPLLCKVPGLNGNGSANGGTKYKCNYLACPPGTASVLGRESLDGGVKCLECRNGANTLGLKDCSHFTPPPWADMISNSGSGHNEDWYQDYQNSRTFGIVMLSLTFVALSVMSGLFIYKRYYTKHGSGSGGTHSKLSQVGELTTRKGANDEVV